MRVKNKTEIEIEVSICDCCGKQYNKTNNFFVTMSNYNDVLFEYFPSCDLCSKCGKRWERIVLNRLYKRMDLYERYNKNENTKKKEIEDIKEAIKNKEYNELCED